MYDSNRILKMTAYSPAYADCYGSVWSEARIEWEPPILVGGDCWIIYGGVFGKYKIKHATVIELCFNGTRWYWRIDTHRKRIHQEDYGVTFFADNELQKATEACDKMNRLRKVKVK